jgi:2-C-methyl-D-erythritol 4-phosphate cytidylyltransferase
MVDWSLAALRAADSVGAIVVAVPPAFLVPRSSFLGDDVTIVEGGETRSESVRNGLEKVGAEFVVVHDAARPLLTPELVEALLEALLDRPDAAAVIAAAPLTDTVKRAREPRANGEEAPPGAATVEETLSRDRLWAAQTPQVFRTEALREAIDADPERLAAATDDAWLVEQAGGEVLIVPAPAENFKVTTPNDLRIAELLLGSRV